MACNDGWHVCGFCFLYVLALLFFLCLFSSLVLYTRYHRLGSAFGKRACISKHFLFVWGTGGYVWSGWHLYFISFCSTWHRGVELVRHGVVLMCTHLSSGVNGGPSGREG